MSAYVPQCLRQKLASDAEHERQSIGIKKVSGWTEKPWEWHTKQTARAVKFPTYGWLPKVAIAGRAMDGTIVPWNSFRHDHHQFLIADWYLKKAEATP